MRDRTSVYVDVRVNGRGSLGHIHGHGISETYETSTEPACYGLKRNLKRKMLIIDYLPTSSLTAIDDFLS